MLSILKFKNMRPVKVSKKYGEYLEYFTKEIFIRFVQNKENAKKLTTAFKDVEVNFHKAFATFKFEKNDATYLVVEVNELTIEKTKIKNTYGLITRKSECLLGIKGCLDRMRLFHDKNSKNSIKILEEGENIVVDKKIVL